MDCKKAEVQRYSPKSCGGYNRSSKKCKEKFENVHIYYKKTKDGRAGRQDGKNYRFFVQLKSQYGGGGGGDGGGRVVCCMNEPNWFRIGRRNDIRVQHKTWPATKHKGNSSFFTKIGKMLMLNIKSLYNNGISKDEA
jgi:hypothetical protein